MITRPHYSFILTTALLALISSASTTHAETVRWRTNLDAAKIEATQAGKLVLLHFWTPSCGPCKALDQDVFSQPQVGDCLEQRFVPVKVNAELSPALAGAYRIDRVPTDVVLTHQGNVVAKLNCPLQYEAYLGQLNNVSTHYSQTMSNPNSPVESPTQQAYGGLQTGQYNTQPVVTSAQQTDPAAMTPAAAYTSNPFMGSSQAPGQGTAQMAPAPAPQMLQSSANPYSSAAAPAAAPVMAQQSIAAQSPAHQSQVTAAPQMPPGSPSLAFDGYCPVTLKTAHKWVAGNPQFGAVHRGRTFLFTGEAQRQQFLADPDTYSPVFSGMDPVMMLDQNRAVEGSRKFGYEYRGSFYLFSSQETMAHFANDPDRYSTQVRQAMNRLDASASGSMRR